MLKKLAKANETRKADLPNPPESPTGILTALALVGVALIFLASIGEVLIRIAEVSGWLIIAFVIAAAGARFFLEKWPDWALKVTGTVGAWWSKR
jgi:hypothetical protein